MDVSDAVTSTTHVKCGNMSLLDESFHDTTSREDVILYLLDFLKKALNLQEKHPNSHTRSELASMGKHLLEHKPREAFSDNWFIMPLPPYLPLLPKPLSIILDQIVSALDHSNDGIMCKFLCWTLRRKTGFIRMLEALNSSYLPPGALHPSVISKAHMEPCTRITEKVKNRAFDEAADGHGPPEIRAQSFAAFLAISLAQASLSEILEALLLLLVPNEAKIQRRSRFDEQGFDSISLPFAGEGNAYPGLLTHLDELPDMPIEPFIKRMEQYAREEEENIPNLRDLQSLHPNRVWKKYYPKSGRPSRRGAFNMTAISPVNTIFRILTTLDRLCGCYTPREIITVPDSKMSKDMLVLLRGTQRTIDPPMSLILPYCIEVTDAVFNSLYMILSRFLPSYLGSSTVGEVSLISGEDESVTYIVMSCLRILRANINHAVISGADLKFELTNIHQILLTILESSADSKSPSDDVDSPHSIMCAMHAEVISILATGLKFFYPTAEKVYKLLTGLITMPSLQMSECTACGCGWGSERQSHASAGSPGKQMFLAHLISISLEDVTGFLMTTLISSLCDCLNTKFVEDKPDGAARWQLGRYRADSNDSVALLLRFVHAVSMSDSHDDLGESKLLEVIQKCVMARTIVSTDDRDVVMLVKYTCSLLACCTDLVRNGHVDVLMITELLIPLVDELFGNDRLMNKILSCEYEFEQPHDDIPCPSSVKVTASILLFSNFCPLITRLDGAQTSVLRDNMACIAADMCVDLMKRSTSTSHNLDQVTCARNGLIHEIPVIPCDYNPYEHDPHMLGIGGDLVADIMRNVTRVCIHHECTDSIMAVHKWILHARQETGAEDYTEICKQVNARCEVLLNFAPSYCDPYAFLCGSGNADCLAEAHSRDRLARRRALGLRLVTMLLQSILVSSSTRAKVLSSIETLVTLSHDLVAPLDVGLYGASKTNRALVWTEYMALVSSVLLMRQDREALGILSLSGVEITRVDAAYGCLTTILSTNHDAISWALFSILNIQKNIADAQEKTMSMLFNGIHSIEIDASDKPAPISQSVDEVDPSEYHFHKIAVLLCQSPKCKLIEFPGCQQHRCMFTKKKAGGKEARCAQCTVSTNTSTRDGKPFSRCLHCNGSTVVDWVVVSEAELSFVAQHYPPDIASKGFNLLKCNRCSVIHFPRYGQELVTVPRDAVSAHLHAIVHASTACVLDPDPTMITRLTFRLAKSEMIWASNSAERTPCLSVAPHTSAIHRMIAPMQLNRDQLLDKAHHLEAECLRLLFLESCLVCVHGDCQCGDIGIRLINLLTYSKTTPMFIMRLLRIARSFLPLAHPSPSLIPPLLSFIGKGMLSQAGLATGNEPSVGQIVEAIALVRALASSTPMREAFMDAFDNVDLSHFDDAANHYTTVGVFGVLGGFEVPLYPSATLTVSLDDSHAAQGRVIFVDEGATLVDVNGKEMSVETSSLSSPIDPVKLDPSLLTLTVDRLPIIASILDMFLELYPTPHTTHVDVIVRELPMSGASKSEVVKKVDPDESQDIEPRLMLKSVLSSVASRALEHILTNSESAELFFHADLFPALLQCATTPHQNLLRVDMAAPPSEEPLQSRQSIKHRNVCTVYQTGTHFVEQHWYHCISCSLVDEEGCCAVCMQECHRGHHLTYGGFSPFFCDCGHGSSPCMARRPRDDTDDARTLSALLSASNATGLHIQYVAPTSEEDKLVNELVEMGFSREASEKALKLTKNDLHAAATWLLDHGEAELLMMSLHEASDRLQRHVQAEQTRQREQFASALIRAATMRIRPDRPSWRGWRQSQGQSARNLFDGSGQPEEDELVNLASRIAVLASGTGSDESSDVGLASALRHRFGTDRSHSDRSVASSNPDPVHVLEPSSMSSEADWPFEPSDDSKGSRALPAFLVPRVSDTSTSSAQRSVAETVLDHQVRHIATTNMLIRETFRHRRPVIVPVTVDLVPIEQLVPGAVVTIARTPASVRLASERIAWRSDRIAVIGRTFLVEGVENGMVSLVCYDDGVLHRVVVPRRVVSMSVHSGVTQAELWTSLRRLTVKKVDASLRRVAISLMTKHGQWHQISPNPSPSTMLRDAFAVLSTSSMINIETAVASIDPADHVANHAVSYATSTLRRCSPAAVVVESSHPYDTRPASRLMEIHSHRGADVSVVVFDRRCRLRSPDKLEFFYDSDCQNAIQAEEFAPFIVVSPVFHMRTSERTGGSWGWKFVVIPFIHAVSDDSALNDPHPTLPLRLLHTLVPHVQPERLVQIIGCLIAYLVKQPTSLLHEREYAATLLKSSLRRVVDMEMTDPALLLHISLLLRGADSQYQDEVKHPPPPATSKSRSIPILTHTTRLLMECVELVSHRLLGRENCSYLFTSSRFRQQPWFSCITCKLVGSIGVCGACAMHCHAALGHQIMFSNNSDFFCDCGNNDHCRCSKLEYRDSTMQARWPHVSSSELDEIMAKMSASATEFHSRLSCPSRVLAARDLLLYIARAEREVPWWTVSSSFEPAPDGWMLLDNVELVSYVQHLGKVVGASMDGIGIESFRAIESRDMRLAFPRLAGVPSRILIRLFSQLRVLNRIVINTLPLIILPSGPSPIHINSTEDQLDPLQDCEGFGDCLAGCRALIFLDVKMSHLNRVLNETTQAQGQSAVTINRHRATRGGEAKDTIFMQVYRQVNGIHVEAIRRKDQPWRTVMVGEASEDVGGPFREMLTDMCEELMSEAPLHLFKLCPNGRAAVGINQEKCLPSASITQYRSLYVFIGKLMGISLRTKVPLALSLPSIIFKGIVSQPLCLDDLASIDVLTYRLVKQLRSDECVSEVYTGRCFTFFKCSGDDEVDLVHEGRDLAVTDENRREYADLIVNFRLTEFNAYVEAIVQGIKMVVPEPSLSIFTWQEIEILLCGRADFDVDAFQANTVYEVLGPTDKVVQYFWSTLRKFSPNERSLFFRFVLGWSRPPMNMSDLPRNFKLRPMFCNNPDRHLPMAHTLDIPLYSTGEILRERLLYAITTCRAVDADLTTAAVHAREMDWSDDEEDV